MKSPDIELAAGLAARRAKYLGLTQEAIATAINVSQSQVSRVLSGAPVRRSKVFDRICKYVDSYSSGIPKEEVCRNPDLIDALSQTWDGTEIHAKALANVIRSLGALKSNANAVAVKRDETP